MHAGLIFESEIISFFEKVLKVKIEKEYEIQNEQNYHADLFFEFEGKRYIGEIKYYRSPLAQINLLRRAALKITAIAQAVPHVIPVLIVSCYVSKIQRELLINNSNLILIDRVTLLSTISTSGEYFRTSLLLNSDDVATYSNDTENDLIKLLSKE